MFDVLQLERIGLKVGKKIYYNRSVAELVETSVKLGEGSLCSNGALVVTTGERTGRSPEDRYIIDFPRIHNEIWWGDINKPASEDKFNYLFSKIKAYLADKDLFVFDAYSGADKQYRLPVRVVSPKAWHSLFAETLFVRPTPEDLEGFVPEFTVINASEDMRLDPKKDGFGSTVAVLVNLDKRIMLIAGSGYGGEIKKGIFTVMNYFLPKKKVFPMHCSVNVEKDGDSAFFFGLSGTGKTTLSADPNRRLIGDDQHGWSDDGVFNFEGGCYAKCINLSREAEPQIYDAIRFGSILENVVIDKNSRVANYADASITENTRVAYPIDYISNCITKGTGGHPKNIFFLTCDAFGVLPPIAKLTPEMAMYHFISGYTAKVAGTEYGVVEPVAVFSACFGAPFMPLNPNVYAEQLREKLNSYNSNCWLVNTGWSGGIYGVGARMKISLTRSLLSAALSGKLDNAIFKPHPIFKVLVPEDCSGVDSHFLDPENTWKDKGAYKEVALKLAGLFNNNFKKFSDKVSKEVIACAPGVA